MAHAPLWGREACAPLPHLQTNGGKKKASCLNFVFAAWWRGDRRSFWIAKLLTSRKGKRREALLVVSLRFRIAKAGQKGRVRESKKRQEAGGGGSLLPQSDLPVLGAHRPPRVGAPYARPPVPCRGPERAPPPHRAPVPMPTTTRRPPSTTTSTLRPATGPGQRAQLMPRRRPALGAWS